jgi:hypothetical protein
MTTVGWNRPGTWASLDDDKSGNEPAEPFGHIDYVLFAAFTMSGLTLNGFPVSELAAGIAVALAVFRRARVRPTIGISTLLLLALFALMVFSALENDLTPARRLAHLLLYVALGVLASQGRFRIRGMSRGLATGLLVSAGAYYVGYGSSYVGRLTGLLADPNAAGYVLSTLGCVALAGMTTSRLRWPVGLLVLVAIVETYSRTSMLATLLVLVWMLIGRRVSTVFGSLLLGVMLYVVTNIPSTLQQIGPFADRVGSDMLRGRIVAQEKVLIAHAPWSGNGPGTSHVDVLGDTFFFHNSYLALENEGGRVAIAIVVALGLSALLGLMRLPMQSRNFWYEGAVIAMAVCAVNLGEVLLELPAALAIGMAVRHARAVRATTSRNGPPEPLLGQRLDVTRL